MIILTKTKQIPTSLTFSPDSSHFSTLSHPSSQIRVFNFLTGKMTRKYDESMSAAQEMQQAGTAAYKMDDMEFGRRLAVERELEKDEKAGRTMNTVWDESGNFLIYPTLLGIKGRRSRRRKL
jgi:peptidylprolyl isomerase domain and WD repeat-containing protein 1